MRRGRRVMSFVVGTLWVVVPVVAAGVLLVRADDGTSAPTDESTWVPVGPEVTTVDAQVTLALTWAVPPPLVAPAWSGLVERVDIAPGATLGSGAVVARIGGVDRLLIWSSAPFGRPLQLDDAGSDVAALNEILASLGLPAGRNDRFGDVTRTGVRALGEQLGVDSEVFDPGWFVYSPAPTVVVATVDLAVAAPAPTPGTPIATARPALLAATATGSLPGGPGAIVVAGREVAAVAPDGTIDLVALASVLEPTATTVDVVLRRAPPDGARQIPADSVVTSVDGGTCVLTRAGTGGEVEPRRVTVLGSRLGVATVTGLDHDGDVLVDVGTAERSRC